MIKTTDLSNLWKAKELTKELDKVLNTIKKDLEKFQFKNRNPGNSQLNFTHNIYRKRIEYKNKVYYDAGFGFGQENIWVYAGLVFPLGKYKSESIKKVEALLESYKINSQNKREHQIVISILLTDSKFMENDEISIQKVTNWLKNMVAEVKEKEAEVFTIIDSI